MLHSRSSRSSLTLRLAVDVKHAGRTQSIVVEDTGSVLALKAEISKVTGVPLERMKVMLKTGILKLTGNIKDNADLTKLGPDALQPMAHRIR
ncbi:hypothetical protein JCM24511_06859 [Saitozyma sp. JCM 24511]|nr:hypothetical protein JCM24511_06859 [Saitozyma sp. JCM 24511]